MRCFRWVGHQNNLIPSVQHCSVPFRDGGQFSALVNDGTDQRLISMENPSRKRKSMAAPDTRSILISTGLYRSVLVSRFTVLEENTITASVG